MSNVQATTAPENSGFTKVKRHTPKSRAGRFQSKIPRSRSRKDRAIGSSGDRAIKSQKLLNLDDPITRWPDHLFAIRSSEACASLANGPSGRIFRYCS